MLIWLPYMRWILEIRLKPDIFYYILSFITFVNANVSMCVWTCSYIYYLRNVFSVLLFSLSFNKKKSFFLRSVSVVFYIYLAHAFFLVFTYFLILFWLNYPFFPLVQCFITCDNANTISDKALVTCKIM